MKAMSVCVRVNMSNGYNQKNQCIVYSFFLLSFSFLVLFISRCSFSFNLDEDDTDKDGVTSLSSASPIPAHDFHEHIVKSPPEPTRVKSPEQILMRSPDPVNWIVPLDTGKTFTVTQNIRNGKHLIGMKQGSC